MERGVHHC